MTDAGRGGYQANRVWPGPASACAVAAAWVVLAMTSPTTTHHFAPLVAAAAWPVARRLTVGHRLRVLLGLRAAAGSIVVTTAAMIILLVTHSLRGPVLVGATTLVETIAAIVLGSLLGALFAVLFRG